MPIKTGPVIETRCLANGDWSASVKGEPFWGSSWGATERDAVKAIEFYMWDNRNSKDVLEAGLL